MNKKLLEKVLKRIQESPVGRFDSGTQPGEENLIDPKVVPDPEEGDAYVTHRYVGEQEEEKETPEDPEAGGEDMGAGGDAGMGDMGAGGMDTGMGGMGMPGDEDKPKNVDELGRRYELKKIYARLVSIESNLADSSDTHLLKLRSYVSQAIDLFKTMIFNIDLFQDNIDDIIVVFYEFLKYTYAILKKFYEEQEE